MKHAIVAALASLGLMACSSSSSTSTSTSGSTGRNGATATGTTTTGTTTSSTGTSRGSSGSSAGSTSAGSTSSTRGSSGGSTTTTTAGSTTAAGSTSGGSTTTAGSTTAAGSTSGGSTTTAGSTGGSGSTGAAPDVATARISPSGTPAALTGVLAIMASSYGNPVDGGGTDYSGKYFVMDPNTNQAIFVYKPKSAAALSYDPSRLDQIDVSGTVTTYPNADGGQVEIAEPNLDIVDAGGPGTLVFVAQTATELQVSDSSPDQTLVGFYLTVPAPAVGSYTLDDAPPELTKTTSSGTRVNGVALVDSTTNARILVDTATFKYSAGNCLPNDGGGVPTTDLTTGNFNGVLDVAVTGDGKSHKVVFYGHCGQ